LTGGIREGAKGEPPVGHFSNGHGSLFIALCKGPPIFLASLKKSLRNFFLFIRRSSGIRHDPGGNLSVRLAIESWSASLFSLGSFHQQQAISFQPLDLLCPAKPRVFVLEKQLRQRMRRSQ
jgi:hypothetical protein